MQLECGKQGMYTEFQLGNLLKKATLKIEEMDNTNIYKGLLKTLWTGGSASPLHRGRRKLLCQVVVVGVM
jgi:hypothetical protein